MAANGKLRKLSGGSIKRSDPASENKKAQAIELWVPYFRRSGLTFPKENLRPSVLWLSPPLSRFSRPAWRVSRLSDNALGFFSPPASFRINPALRRGSKSRPSFVRLSPSSKFKYSISCTIYNTPHSSFFISNLIILISLQQFDRVLRLYM